MGREAPTVALELMPEADDAPPATLDALLALGPDLCFASDPPGRDNARLVDALRARVGARCVPHVTTRNRTATEVAERIGGWRGAGIDGVLALRGDATGTCDLARDTRLRSATELTRLLHGLDPALGIWVAGYPEVHPEAQSAASDMHALVAKVAAGATGVVAQFAFDAAPVLRFRDACHAAGIAVPLLAGVMLAEDPAWLAPFARRCGAPLGAEVERAFGRWADDPASLAAFAVEHATALTARLLGEDLDGVVFFSRNRHTGVAQVWRALGLGAFSAS